MPVAIVWANSGSRLTGSRLTGSRLVSRKRVQTVKEGERMYSPAPSASPVRSEGVAGPVGH